jgi:hypothetical protein
LDCGVAVFEAPETSGDNNAEPGDADASETVRFPGMMHFIILSCGIHMGVESCESKVVKEVPELGPVLWPYRGRYLTKKSPLAQLSRYRLCRLNIFTCQQNLEPF